ncbi:MAG: RNA-splicing ligase RtcB [Chloroflexi bacterium HGW-Chloroflexi-1]|nr:MAG: RNA-splicing ligase RtcB [Chloroflexi bacterium HGW-Chloroflexi-1]
MKPVTRYDLRKIGDYLYEVPQSFRHDMRVPARVYADEEMLEAALSDRSVEQVINTATLPGVVQYVVVMPDCHQGYGFAIGNVAATRLPHGIISPGGVGYDINCGVRLLGTHLDIEDVRPHIDRLADAFYRHVPSGLGTKGNLHLNQAEMDEILAKGSKWAQQEGYARPKDVAHTEERGQMAGADPTKVSAQAKKRGLGQVGTLGSGNHFAELDVVTEIFDADAADTFGLRRGQVAVQVHCGSRGLGHQVATDYIQEYQQASKRFGYELPDRELVCAPLDSPEGQNYLAAMNCAANYAWANRQVLTYQLREAFEEVLGGRVPDWDLFLVYDVAHNMAKIETHQVEGRDLRLCVHRKGATRAFGPGHPDVPADYRAVGQPVLVPGSMGTASYVLVGTAEGMRQTFGSCCHGAGRAMSRSEAKRLVRGQALQQELERAGISIRAGSMAGLAEEAPQAYKDVERVVAVVAAAGLGRIVARLEPLAVVKG